MERLPEFWRGTISGTNRASVLARLQADGTAVRLRVLLDDAAAGPASCNFAGTLTGSHAELRLVSFAPSGPLFPMAITLTLDITDDGCAKGTWSSDIGTAGVCELRAVNLSSAAWWWRVAVTSAGLLFQSPTYYANALLVIAGLTLLRVLHLTYPVLLLVLVPALFIFRQHIRGLIDYFGLTKAGPFEFQRVQAPGVSLDDYRAFLRAGVNVIGGDLTRVVNDETVTFLAFDWFFALWTKLLLLWLMQQGRAAASDLGPAALKLGIPQDNVPATVAALFAAEVVAVDDEGHASLTARGRRYASHLLLAGALQKIGTDQAASVPPSSTGEGE